MAGNDGTPVGIWSPPDFVTSSSLAQTLTSQLAQPPDEFTVTHQAATRAG